MTNLSLYQIANEYRAAADLLEQLDLDEQTLADTLDGMDGDLTVKLQNTAFVVRNLESLAEQITLAAAGMTGRAKKVKERAEHVKAHILMCMQLAEVQKIETPYFRLSIRKNPASVAIDDERQIPAAYFVDVPAPPPQLSKTLISDAIALGVEVPGARLVQKFRLEIR